MENYNMISQPIMTNLEQGAHIHQPTAWPVPHTCAQPCHPGSGSHGQLFRLIGSHYETTICWSLICTSSPTVAGVEWRVGVCVGVGGRRRGMKEGIMLLFHPPLFGSWHAAYYLI